jgi:hypothetical protein
MVKTLFPTPQKSTGFLRWIVFQSGLAEGSLQCSGEPAKSGTGGTFQFAGPAARRLTGDNMELHKRISCAKVTA